MAYKKTPNSRPIINITIPDELLKQVDDYQFDERKRSRSEAICKLAELGLEVYRKEKMKKSKVK